MDEKRAFEQLPITQGSDSGSRQPADDSNRRHHHSRRPLHFLTIATLILSLWAFYRATTSSSRRWQERPLIWGKPYPSHLKGVATTPNIKLDENTLVPFEAHIMSKCPDAKDCLELMVLPAMQRVHDKVNFTLSYIGRPTANDGVACKHGPEECLGNIIELCAQKLYPDPKTYLGFTMCMTKQYSHIPQRSLVEDCALEHALDFNELNNCATEDDGAVGMGMLRTSVRRSSDAGVSTSCTVRVDEKIYCVRDDGEWVDCPSGAKVDDLVTTVEELYHRSS